METLTRRDQLALISDQNPMKARFSSTFFKSIPSDAGVYFFRDEYGRLLYVGKSKNLRKRIASYKQVKRGTHSRKLCRLVYFISSIEWEICPDETQALLRENELLRKHKPIYNRANTRPEYYHYLLLKKETHQDLLRVSFEFSNSVSSDADRIFGAFKSKNIHLSKLQSALSLFDFWQRSEPSYQIPHSHLVKTHPLSTEVRDRNQWVLFLAYLEGMDDRFLVEVEEVLYSIRFECGFTLFQLEKALESAIEFFQGTLSRHYQMMRSWDPDALYVPKEKLDDLRVSHSAQSEHSE